MKPPDSKSGDTPGDALPGRLALPGSSGDPADRSRTSRRRPGIELLLRCSRIPDEDEPPDLIRSLVGEVLDWDELLAAASEHCVVARMHRSLRAIGPEALPEACRARLDQALRETADRNAMLIAELCELHKLFESHGIGAISFKGPTLALLAYGEVNGRQYYDLDIVVRGRDVPGARDLLTARGYHPCESAVDYHVEFSRPGGSLFVEIHWAFAPKSQVFPIDTDAFWDRFLTVDLGGASVPTFSPTDLLLILCVHGAKHRWGRLGWTADVAHLIDRNPAIDWEALLDRVRKSGHLRVLLLGVRLAIDLCGGHVPPHVEALVRSDAALDRLVGPIAGRLFRDASGDGGRDDEKFYGSWSFFLRLSERRRDRLRRGLLYLRIAASPSQADHDFIRLPRSLALLYYAIRPVRIGMKALADPRWLFRLLKSLFGSSICP